MKISLKAIVVGHVTTLRDYRSGKISLEDIIIFFVLPMTSGALSYFLGFEVTNDFLDVLISAFSIFSALLFSAQVAIYGIFRADRRRQDDPIMQMSDRAKFEQVRSLLREINANISYLIMIAFLAVSLFLLFFAFDFGERIEMAITASFFVHFLLTAGMVLKRAHEVFDHEYSS